MYQLKYVAFVGRKYRMPRNCRPLSAPYEEMRRLCDEEAAHLALTDASAFDKDQGQPLRSSSPSSADCRLDMDSACNTDHDACGRSQVRDEPLGIDMFCRAVSHKDSISYEKAIVAQKRKVQTPSSTTDGLTEDYKRVTEEVAAVEQRNKSGNAAGARAPDKKRKPPVSAPAAAPTKETEAKSLA